MKTQTAVQQPAVSASSSLVQVSGALTAIILFILLAAWLVKRFGFGGKVGAPKGLKVSASTSVGPRERVVIIDVEDARLVLGVTASQITHLHTLPPAAVSQEPASSEQVDFQSVMKNLLKRNGKAE
ncbi:flagellar type III secretion system protein FliO [Enterobacteriaceae bacterium H11S18]|uniref:flagellar biosynthetic protein FliO n=1 Tax=Dryocola clanedunensis TaxID=2925396 RepID=UPI0022F08D7B|nr:flagellar biosynthetic protein FliO [Dryocola clanedunensis]MCT4712178.1 flagellar type III secretion system protein FliO [Dryocola clanedunensis]